MLSLKTAAGVGVMLFSATFSYFVEETRVPRENHRHAASHWQTLSYVIKALDLHLPVPITIKVVSLNLTHGEVLQHNVIKFVSSPRQVVVFSWDSFFIH